MAKEKSILSSHQKNVLDLISDEQYFTKRYYLAGGTALFEFYPPGKLSRIVLCVFLRLNLVLFLMGMDEKKINEIRDILTKNDIEYAALFGSRARGDNKADSDYDILIRFKKDKEPGFFKYLEIEEKISEILKQKVDLVTEESLSPYIKDYVVEDLKVIYQ